jgi:hypothetical protein
MTDAEQLVTLRAWLGWPWKTLDPLAVEAATMGRLREVVEETDRLTGERKVNGSNWGLNDPVAQAPLSDFSYLENRSNVFYKRLRIELHRPLSKWAGWD